MNLTSNGIDTSFPTKVELQAARYVMRSPSNGTRQSIGHPGLCCALRAYQARLLNTRILDKAGSSLQQRRRPITS